MGKICLNTSATEIVVFKEKVNGNRKSKMV